MVGWFPIAALESTDFYQKLHLNAYIPSYANDEREYELEASDCEELPQLVSSTRPFGVPVEGMVRNFTTPINYH